MCVCVYVYDCVYVCGVVWCDVVWCGVMWCGVVCCVYIVYKKPGAMVRLNGS